MKLPQERVQIEKQRELRHSSREVQTSKGDLEGVEKDKRKIREWDTINANWHNLFQTQCHRDLDKTKGWELAVGFGKLKNFGEQRGSISY